MSQKKFKTVFDQLQVVLETAVAEEGWQGSNAVAGGELLVQFQDASEDVTSKTRLMLAIFLAWDLVTAMASCFFNTHGIVAFLTRFSV